VRQYRNLPGGANDTVGLNEPADPRPPVNNRIHGEN
jgi:hypothetical protein